jgi:hypothetical protein
MNENTRARVHGISAVSSALSVASALYCGGSFVVAHLEADSAKSTELIETFATFGVISVGVALLSIVIALSTRPR